MASSSEPQEVEMTAEDRKNITTFSRLHQRTQELEKEIEIVKKEVQTLKDADEEVQCCMESDGILFEVGDAYTNMDDTDACEKLEEMRSAKEANLASMTDELETSLTKVAELKNDLYAKFGNSIALETS